MKRIDVMPAEEFELVDPESKKVYSGIFNMRCIMFFQNKLSEMNIGVSNIEKVDMLALYLYSAISAHDEKEFDYHEAKELSKKMSPASGAEIIRMFNDSIMDSLDEEKKKMLKKTMAQIAMMTRK